MSAIKMMGQHGFHEPAFPDRLKESVILQAKQEHVSWLPSDEKILAMPGRNFSGLVSSLRAELRAIEGAKTTDWQEIDTAKLGSDYKLRVRAVQADKARRRAEENYRKLVHNGEHELLATYEQERESLLAEIQRLNDERTDLAQRLEKATEKTLRAVASPRAPASAEEGVSSQRDTFLVERLADTVLMSVGQMRTDYQTELVNRMDSEINFLRSVVERLMAK